MFIVSGQFSVLVNDSYENPEQSSSPDHNRNGATTGATTGAATGATTGAATGATTCAASGDAADSARGRRGPGCGSHGTRKWTPTVEGRDGEVERSSAATGRDDLSRSGSLRAAIQRVFQAGGSLQGKAPAAAWGRTSAPTGRRTSAVDDGGWPGRAGIHFQD